MSPEKAAQSRGVLVAVVGPSGAGKDTLIRLAMARLSGEPRIGLVRRVVTRPTDEASEDHDSLDEAGFERAETAGAFCLTWRAHGLAYGLPGSALREVEGGAVMLANLSRRSLDLAARRFGGIAVVEITAPHEVLVARIVARGREDAAAVAARLARQVDATPPPGTRSWLRIDNSGSPDAGADRLRRHLLELAGATCG